MSLTGYFLNSLWQFPAILLATWILVRLQAGRHVFFRYKLWLAGLILSVALPACPRPNIHLPVPTSAHSPVNALLIARPHDVIDGQRESHTALVEFMTMAYCGVVGLGGFRLLLGLAGTFCLLRKSSPIALPPASARHYEAMVNRLDLKTVPTLRVQANISSPATAGWRNPCILLPATVYSWSEGDLSAALGHELMHIVRNDYAWNIVCHALLLPLLYNPLSWWLRRQIEIEREMVCDEMAANLSKDREAYAQALLSISRTSFNSRHGFALNWYSKHPLEERIMQLVASTTRKQPNRWSFPLSMTVLGGVAITLTLGSSLVARAESQTSSVTIKPAPYAEATKNTQQQPLAIAKGAHARVMKQRGTFEHQWKAADGQNIVILTRSPEPPTAEEREKVEKTINENKFTLDSLSALSSSTDRKLEALDFKSMKERMDKAELVLNDPAFQKRMQTMSQALKEREQEMHEAEKALSTRIDQQ